MDKAVLISINWDTEETMHSFIDGPRAISKATALKESIEDDWPGWEHRVIATVTAREEHADQLVDRLFRPSDVA